MNIDAGLKKLNEIVKMRNSNGFVGVYDLYTILLAMKSESNIENDSKNTPTPSTLLKMIYQDTKRIKKLEGDALEKQDRTNRQWLREWVTDQVHNQNRRIGELEMKSGSTKKAWRDRVEERLEVLETMINEHVKPSPFTFTGSAHSGSCEVGCQCDIAKQKVGIPSFPNVITIPRKVAEEWLQAKGSLGCHSAHRKLASVFRSALGGQDAKK